MTNSMVPTVYVGLALTSHNSSSLCTAAFDNVTAPGWPASTPPAMPTNLAATAGEAQVALSWSASSDAADYLVKRSVLNGGGYVNIATNAGVAFTNTGLANGTLYYFVVSAQNSAGESTNSAPVCARPTSLAPVALNVTNVSGQLGFAWPANHTGWQLQLQTNRLGTNWVIVTGSAQTNLVAMPVDKANGAVFFRLVRP